MWLQRDLSLLGRVLLSKADSISRFVYSTLSLSSATLFLLLINSNWTNKCHDLKKEILAGPRGDGGMGVLHFTDMNYTFKLKWIKEYLKEPHNHFATLYH